MRNKKVIIAIVIVLLLIVGMIVYQKSTQKSELTLSGNVDIRQVNVSFRVGGRLKKLFVDEGAEIKSGDVLGLLDNQPQKIALSQAQANEAALAARRALYKEGYRKEDIQQAKDNLNARIAAQTNADIALKRQKKLINTGANAQRNLDDAQSNYDQASALTNAARQQYQSLHSGFRKEEVDEVEANYNIAVAQLNDATLKLSDTVLKAPSDGVILTRAVEPGTMLNPGSSVFTVSLTKPVWVRAYVAEPDLGNVAPGTRVKVKTDSRSEPYDGVVGFVSPTAEFTPKNVETTDLRTSLVYRLRIVVDNPDKQLRQGMPVTVKVTRPS